MYRKVKILARKIADAILLEKTLDSDQPQERELFSALADEQKRTELWNQFCQNDRTEAVACLRKELMRKVYMKRLRHWSQIAAIIVLVVGAGGGIWQQLLKEKKEPLIQNVIIPGKVQAQLQLADGTIIDLNEQSRDSIFLQAGTVISTEKGGLYYQDDSTRQKIQYNHLMTPRGGEYRVTLADGTIVTLNSESELRYPISFQSGQRRVYCHGEAYFQVAHDQEHPFIVDCDGMAVEVLGTEFNLNTYRKKDIIYTTLVKGSVKVSAAGNEIVIKPGEQARFDLKQQQIDKKWVDVEEEIAWRNGRFILDGLTLAEIMEQLMRWYDFTCFYQSDNLKEIIFRGSMPRYGDFQEVLNVLSGTGEVKFEVKGKTVVVQK